MDRLCKQDKTTGKLCTHQGTILPLIAGKWDAGVDDWKVRHGFRGEEIKGL